MMKVRCSLCRRRDVICQRVNRLYCDDCNDFKATLEHLKWGDYSRWRTEHKRRTHE